MRILFLSVCFPSPANLTLGVWALRQAQAIQRTNAKIKVIRFSPWFPSRLRKISRIRRVADGPSIYNWDGLEVHYYRWPFYQIGWLRRQWHANPWPQARLSFTFVHTQLLRTIVDFSPDVIYAHHTCASGYVAFRLHQLTAIPYIITDHSFDEIGDCANLPARYNFFQTIQAKAACMVDVSNRMQEIRRSLFPEIKSVVVHNGADPIPDIMFDAPRPADIEGRLVVNCVSIWYDRKGIPKLIEAFARIAGDFPNAVLRLVGDGPDRPAVMAAIKASPAKQQIHVLGSQPHERALQEMCWSDIFALIGREEPYGVAFTEAMMAGLPLIWPSDCGHNDVLSDGVHGIKVPPWDVYATAAALRKMLGEAELRQRIGRDNRTYAIKHLTWDANADKMLEIFQVPAQKTDPKTTPTIQ